MKKSIAKMSRARETVMINTTHVYNTQRRHCIFSGRTFNNRNSPTSHPTKTKPDNFHMPIALVNIYICAANDRYLCSAIFFCQY